MNGNQRNQTQNQIQNQMQEEISDYLDDCTRNRRLSCATLRAYNMDLKQFSAFLRARYPDVRTAKAVDREQIKAYVSELNQVCRVASVKRKLACLKGLFFYLREEKRIETSPFDTLHIRMKTPVRIPEMMSLEEVGRILEAAYHESCCCSELLHLRNIAVLELLFATGLRVQELCSLRCEDFYSQQSYLRVIGKGNKERRVYITNEEVLSALRKYRRLLNEKQIAGDFLFLNKNGAPLSTQAARNIVTKYVKLAGITRHITPHAFRHTFASLLLEEGVDIRYIQEFLGHSSISTTQLYLHVPPRACKEIIHAKHPREKLSLAE